MEDHHQEKVQENVAEAAEDQEIQRIFGIAYRPQDAGTNVIDKDEHKHFLKPEQEVRNYYMALNYLEEQIAKKPHLQRNFILKVQSIGRKRGI